jgi:hypothetical protein
MTVIFRRAGEDGIADDGDFKASQWEVQGCLWTYREASFGKTPGNTKGSCLLLGKMEALFDNLTLGRAMVSLSHIRDDQCCELRKGSRKKQVGKKGQDRGKRLGDKRRQKRGSGAKSPIRKECWRKEAVLWGGGAGCSWLPIAAGEGWLSGAQEHSKDEEGKEETHVSLTPTVCWTCGRHIHIYAIV